MARRADPQRRANILAAARSIFAEQGFIAARMSTIATRAHVAVGTLYLYFPSKEALGQALTSDYFERLAQVLEPALHDLSTPAKIADAVHAALAFARRDPAMLRIGYLDLGTGPTDQDFPFTIPFFQSLVSVLETNMQQGIMRQYDPDILADILIGLFKSTAEATLRFSPATQARYDQTLVQALQSLLLIREPAPQKHGQ
ncbi:MAG: hypothetical protein NVSMB42_01670 [Herpetosiphon sp.]